MERALPMDDLDTRRGWALVVDACPTGAATSEDNEAWPEIDASVMHEQQLVD